LGIRAPSWLPRPTSSRASRVPLCEHVCCSIAELARGKRSARGVRQAGGSVDICRARCRIGRIGAGDNKAVEGRAGHLDDERGALAVDSGEVVDTRPPAGAERDDPGQAGTGRADAAQFRPGVSLTRTTRTEASGMLMFPRSAPIFSRALSSTTRWFPSTVSVAMMSLSSLF
jgi:hypothetical protein